MIQLQKLTICEPSTIVNCRSVEQACMDRLHGSQSSIMALRIKSVLSMVIRNTNCVTVCICNGSFEVTSTLPGTQTWSTGAAAWARVLVLCWNEALYRIVSVGPFTDRSDLYARLKAYRALDVKFLYIHIHINCHSLYLFSNIQSYLPLAFISPKQYYVAVN